MSRCLTCGSALPSPFLDFGPMPLANSLVRPERASEPDERFRLAVSFCEPCVLVQLTDPVSPEKLFRDYLYFSSYSETFLEHARRMAESLRERLALGAGSQVLELASNDGYLLKYFQAMGMRVVGVEPARNVAAVAVARGIPTVTEFFGPPLVDTLLREFGPADVVIGLNVLAHVPAIAGFLGAVRDCLKPNGAAVFEFPYLEEMMERTAFDTIYHEHVYYLSLTAVRNLAARAGLEVWDVSRQSVHGGSLRVFLQIPGARQVSPAVERLAGDESGAGLADPGRYSAFSKAVMALRDSIRAFLIHRRSAGRTIAAYGAPAKGNMLLNFCGLDRATIDFTVDRNPHKQGLLLPGSRIPIFAPEELVRRRPDMTLILPWNFADEIVGLQREYLRLGGRFVVPIPEPREVAV